MRTASRCLALTVVVVSVVWARPPLTTFVRDITVLPREPLIGSGIGHSARSMGMGGTALASTTDFSASVSNPALLSNVRRVELFGGIGHFVQTNQATGHTSAFPFPTYRGSLVFSAGVIRTNDLSYTTAYQDSFEFVPGDDFPDDLWPEFETTGRSSRKFTADGRTEITGDIRQLVFAGAMDLSANIAIGVGLNIHSGSSRYERRLLLLEHSQPQGVFPDSLVGEYWHDDDFSAFSARIGVIYRGGYGTQWSLSVESPTTFSISRKRNDLYIEAHGETIDYYDPANVVTGFDYDLELPFRFGVAASWSAFNWTFAGDILYSDWTQAKYADLPIAKGSSPENQPYYRTLFDRYFQKRYRPTTDLRLGLEFLVPLVSIAVRGGYALHPDPYIGPGIVSKLTVSTSKERQMWTVGFGRLFDQVLMLDIAVTWESHTTRTGPVLSEDSRRRVFANMAYRF